MKKLSDLCKNVEKSLESEKPIICQYVTEPHGLKRFEVPVLSSEKTCDWCRSVRFYTPFVDPAINGERTWLCANIDCAVYERTKFFSATPIPLPLKRAIVWASFCEINHVGNLYHNLKFEDLNQDPKKVAYMLKFGGSPQNILLMRGPPGTGKTFASLAVCELYTRRNTNCIFTTQKRMANNWLETFKKSETYNNYNERVTTTGLLVIDDFGTAEIPPGFMSFLMDLINSRMQWNNRGTIITTNLSIDSFNLFCGDALADRVMTGMIFAYEGKTKRKQNIL